MLRRKLRTFRGRRPFYRQDQEVVTYRGVSNIYADFFEDELFIDVRISGPNGEEITTLDKMIAIITPVPFHGRYSITRLAMDINSGAGVEALDIGFERPIGIKVYRYPETPQQAAAVELLGE